MMDDWRLELTKSHGRTKMVHSIVQYLLKSGSADQPVGRVRDIATQFEQRVYDNATSKESYLGAIAQKLRTHRKRSEQKEGYHQHGHLQQRQLQQHHMQQQPPMHQGQMQHMQTGPSILAGHMGQAMQSSGMVQQSQMQGGQIGHSQVQQHHHMPQEQMRQTHVQGQSPMPQHNQMQQIPINHLQRQHSGQMHQSTMPPQSQLHPSGHRSSHGMQGRGYNEGMDDQAMQKMSSRGYSQHHHVRSGHLAHPQQMDSFPQYGADGYGGVMRDMPDPSAMMQQPGQGHMPMQAAQPQPHQSRTKRQKNQNPGVPHPAPHMSQNSYQPVTPVNQMESQMIDLSAVQNVGPQGPATQGGLRSRQMSQAPYMQNTPMQQPMGESQPANQTHMQSAGHMQHMRQYDNMSDPRMTAPMQSMPQSTTSPRNAVVQQQIHANTNLTQQPMRIGRQHSNPHQGRVPSELAMNGSMPAASHGMQNSYVASNHQQSSYGFNSSQIADPLQQSVPGSQMGNPPAQPSRPGHVNDRLQMGIDGSQKIPRYDRGTAPGTNGTRMNAVDVPASGLEPIDPTHQEMAMLILRDDGDDLFGPLDAAPAPLSQVPRPQDGSQGSRQMFGSVSTSQSLPVSQAASHQMNWSSNNPGSMVQVNSYMPQPQQPSPHAAQHQPQSAQMQQQSHHQSHATVQHAHMSQQQYAPMPSHSQQQSKTTPPPSHMPQNAVHDREHLYDQIWNRLYMMRKKYLEQLRMRKSVYVKSLGAGTTSPDESQRTRLFLHFIDKTIPMLMQTRRAGHPPPIKDLAVLADYESKTEALLKLQLPEVHYGQDGAITNSSSKPKLDHRNVKLQQQLQPHGIPSQHMLERNLSNGSDGQKLMGLDSDPKAGRALVGNPHASRQYVTAPVMPPQHTHNPPQPQRQHMSSQHQNMQVSMATHGQQTSQVLLQSSQLHSPPLQQPQSPATQMMQQPASVQASHTLHSNFNRASPANSHLHPSPLLQGSPALAGTPNSAPSPKLSSLPTTNRRSSTKSSTQQAPKKGTPLQPINLPQALAQRLARVCSESKLRSTAVATAEALKGVLGKQHPWLNDVEVPKVGGKPMARPFMQSGTEEKPESKATTFNDVQVECSNANADQCSLTLTAMEVDGLLGGVPKAVAVVHCHSVDKPMAPPFKILVTERYPEESPLALFDPSEKDYASSTSKSARAAFMRALSTMAVPKLVDVARAWQKVSEADAQVMYMSV